MCVIFIANEARVPEKDIRDSYVNNKDGGGVAWRSKKGGRVRWRKGLELDELLLLADKLPLPYILHLRFATVGGRVPALAHPFPLNHDVTLELRGETKRGVLFHNGHAHGYTADRLAKHAPEGPWSDTRILTWIHSDFKSIANVARDLGALGVGRFAILTPDSLYKVGEFHEVCPGVLASNLHYRAGSSRAHSVVDYQTWLDTYRSRTTVEKWWLRDPTPSLETAPSVGESTAMDLLTSEATDLPTDVEQESDALESLWNEEFNCRAVGEM